MTISAEQEAAAVTLKALQLIRDELGAYTSLVFPTFLLDCPNEKTSMLHFLPWLCKTD